MYADLDSAKAQLGLDDAEPDDAADIALLFECAETVSLLFEQNAGYDLAQTPIWRGATAEATEATARRIWSHDIAGSVVLLSIPALTVDDVQVDGDFPEVLTTDDWTAWDTDASGAIRSIRRADGVGWPDGTGGTYVTVTATWSDGPKELDPPDIVVAACTFLAVEEFRTRKMSPSGELGPDGLTIRPRNPWGYEIVKGALKAARASDPALVF